MPTTHILARAVVRAAGCVLLVRAEGAPHTFLPGGHREPGEGLAECLCRELREEIGAVATVDTYLGAVEHRWRRDDTPQYEINHCFATRLPALSPPTAPVSEEEYLSFEWVEIEQLEAAKLQPAPLRMLLARSAARPTPWWGSTLT
jgi:8-oxo-dGTP pyrophosphatase MutT (NUDIX family)